VEDVRINNRKAPICSEDWFNKNIWVRGSSCSYDPDPHNFCLSANGTYDYACGTDSKGSNIYGDIFTLMLFDKSGFKDKYFLITDLAMPACSSNNTIASGILDVLSNYSDYSSGAPLTVIAIDKKND
jgi:hypothetical protein